MKKMPRAMVIAAAILIVTLLAVQGFRIMQKIEFHQAINKRPLVNFSMDFEMIDISAARDSSRYVIIDMREPEEFEQEHVQGAMNFRTADLIRDPATLERLKAVAADKELALYCYESDYLNDGAGRSGLAAAFLNNQSMKAYVIKDGLQGIKTGQKDMLWQSESVYEIFPREEKVIRKTTEGYLVDVNHDTIIVLLDGNILFETAYTGGDMTTTEWEEFMEKLGGKAIVARCYDNPTCFFSNIIGLRIEKQGGTFKGYYLA